MPNPRKGMTKARRERADRVVKMHDAGATFEDIAKQLGVSKTTVHEDYEKALEEARPDNANRVFRKQDRRLERLHLAYWRKALDGDYKAADIILRVEDRIARLWGIEGSVKVEVNAGGAEFGALLESIRTHNSELISDEELAGRPNTGV